MDSNRGYSGSREIPNIDTNIFTPFQMFSAVSLAWRKTRGIVSHSTRISFRAEQPSVFFVFVLLGLVTISHGDLYWSGYFRKAVDRTLIYRHFVFKIQVYIVKPRGETSILSTVGQKTD